MNLVNYFYNTPPTINKYIDRKVQISDKNTILIGGINSGKTYILINYILKYKKNEILYINLDDIRINRQTFFSELKDFLYKNKNAKYLAIDNAIKDDEQNLYFLCDLELKQIIISTKSNSFNLANFTKLKLLNLDFEEYIAFNKRNSDLGYILGNFLTEGNGVKNSSFSPYELVEFTQKTLTSTYEKNEILVLKECAKLININFSALQIYKNLKDEFKISKDSVYRIIEKLQDENLIYFVNKFGKKTTLKQLYFLDFCMMDILNHKKDFQKKLNNALLCELFKLDKNIYFTDELDFYIPNLNYGFLIIPFTDSDLIFLKFKKIFSHLKELNIKKLYVISMGNVGNMSIEGIKCEILPIWQFCLGI